MSVPQSNSYVQEDDLEDILYNEIEGEETNISKTLQITGSIWSSTQPQVSTTSNRNEDQKLMKSEVNNNGDIDKKMQTLALPFPPSPYSGSHVYVPHKHSAGHLSKSNNATNHYPTSPIPDQHSHPHSGKHHHPQPAPQQIHKASLSPSIGNRHSTLGPPRGPLSPSTRNTGKIRDPPKRHAPTSFLNGGHVQSQGISVRGTNTATLNSPIKVSENDFETKNMNMKQKSKESLFFPHGSTPVGSNESSLVQQSNEAAAVGTLVNEINPSHLNPPNPKNTFIPTYKSKGNNSNTQDNHVQQNHSRSRTNNKIVSPGMSGRVSGGESPMAKLRRMEEKKREKEIAKKEEERTSKHREHISKHGGAIYSAWITRKRSDESFANGQSRWFVLGESYLSYYSNDEATEPRDVILFDAKCSVNIATYPSPEITFHSMGRIFYLTFKSRAEAEVWYEKIDELIRRSQYSKFHDFGSFAPVRHAQESCVRPLVDGKETFGEISTAIESAKEQILLGGWWVSPDVLMKRSNSKVDGFRSVKLSEMLLQAAERGVSIFILIFREMQMALGMNSLYSQNVLSALHPNIHVLRHPFNNAAPHPWSHHEKIVIIDQYISFVGGIDLCFGRYDTHPHDIMFFGNDNDDKTNETDVNTLHPGIDYYNPRHSEFKEVQSYNRDLTDRNNLPRMAWHDVHCMCIGTPSRDVAQHFLVRWNYIRRNSFSIYEDSTLKAIPFLLPFGEGALLNLAKSHHRSKLIGEALRMKNQSENARILEGIKHGKTNIMVPCQVQIVRSIGQWSLGIQTEQSIQTAYCEMISKSKFFIYIENQYFVSKVVTKGNGKYDEAVEFVENTVADSIIERVSRAIREGQPYKAIIVIPAYPAHSGTPLTNKTVRAVLHYQMNGIRRMYSVLKERHPKVDVTSYLSFYTLRNFAVHPLRGPLTEMVYVHSKYMCIDDEISIIGSANINDRSMSGNRDSEVCIIINEQNANYSIEEIEKEASIISGSSSTPLSTLNNIGSKFRNSNDCSIKATSPDGKFSINTIPGAFSKSLRIRLWREHLGTACPHKKKHKSLEAFINGDNQRNTDQDREGDNYAHIAMTESKSSRNDEIQRKGNTQNNIEPNLDNKFEDENLISGALPTSSKAKPSNNDIAFDENSNQTQFQKKKHKKRRSTFGRFTTANHLPSFDAAIENMFFLEDINDEYFLDPLECWQNISVPMACSNTHIYNHVFPYVEQNEYRSADGLSRDAYNYPRRELINNQISDNEEKPTSSGKKVDWTKNKANTNEERQSSSKNSENSSVSEERETRNLASESKNIITYPSRDPYLLSKIRGFLVNFPIDFLCEDDLSPPLSLEYLLPSATFT